MFLYVPVLFLEGAVPFPQERHDFFEDIHNLFSRQKQIRKKNSKMTKIRKKR